MGLFVACSDGTDAEQSAVRTCDDVYEKILQVCQLEFMAEQQRVKCQTRGFTPDALACVGRMTTCDSESAEACDLGSVTWVCDTDASCPGSLICDEARGECASCLDDGHCPEGRVCTSGLCLAQ
jgi:hypothetical protein